MGRLFRPLSQKKNKLVVTDFCRIASLNTQDLQPGSTPATLFGSWEVYLRKCPVGVYVRVTILKWTLS